MPVEIRRLDHAAFLVKDVERSRRFYGQVLGMEEVPRPSNFTFPGAWFRKGRAEIHLIGEAEPGRGAQVQPGGYRPDELSVGYGGNYTGLLPTCQRRGNRLKYTYDERRRTASPSGRKSKPQSVGSGTAPVERAI